MDGGGGWSRLCVKAGIVPDTLDAEIEKAMFRGISNRLLQCSSYSYLSFILKLFSNGGSWNHSNAIENQFAVMAHYDFWQKPGHEFGFASLAESLSALVRDTQLRDECIEVTKQRRSALDVEEIPMDIGVPIALQMHARYTRDEILAAFGENRFDKKSSSREGVVEIRAINCELLFVTLQKTEKKFSPTTLYHDFAINEMLFHWQSQNSARPDKGKGLAYVQHESTGKQLVLFVREQSLDEYGRAMGFVNLGPVKLDSHYGSQPMNIRWQLEQALPPYLWSSAAKLAVG